MTKSPIHGKAIVALQVICRILTKNNNSPNLNQEHNCSVSVYYLRRFTGLFECCIAVLRLSSEQKTIFPGWHPSLCWALERRGLFFCCLQRVSASTFFFLLPVVFAPENCTRAKSVVGPLIHVLLLSCAPSTPAPSSNVMWWSRSGRVVVGGPGSTAQDLLMPVDPLEGQCDCECKAWDAP